MNKNEKIVQFILPDETKNEILSIKEKIRNPESLSNKHSLNNQNENPLSEEKDSNCDLQSLGEGMYRTRLKRQVTVLANPLRDNKFFKVIIPYNFDKKMYWINNKDIQFYENKKYLQEKLEEFNKNEAFNIDNNYSLKGFQKFCMYIPFIIISLIVIYLSIIVSSFFSFNPIVIFTIYTWLRKGYNSVQMFKFILMEKFKIKEIHKLLAEENSSDMCIGNKLKWILGQSGYWLEVQKLVE